MPNPEFMQGHGYRLSKGQFSVWLAQMLDRADPCYSIGECVEILGPVDSPTLAIALRQLVAATEAFHLRVIESEDGPSVQARLDSDWDLPVLDFRSEADPDAAASAWMREDMSRAFQMDCSLLFRFALLQIASDRHFIYVNSHHLPNDGVGWRILLARLAEGYSALIAGKPHAMTLGGSQSELLAEEQAYETSSHYSRDRDYWLQQLANPPAALTLSGKVPARPKGHIKTIGWLPHAIDLDAIGRRYGVAPAVVVIAATAVYLHRMTGVSDMMIGMPVAARVGPRMRSLVGLAANASLLRLTVTPEDGIGEVMAQTSRRMREALRHQRYRGEDIRRDLGLRPTDPELCGTFVNFTPFEDGISFDGHKILRHPLGNWRVEDLQIVFYGGKHPAGQRIDLIANPANYSLQDLEQHRDRFIRILSQLAELEPHRQVRGVEVLTTAERRTVLETWNISHQPVPEATLPDLFEAVVRSKPDAVALVSGDRRVTFHELNAAANRLAHAVIARNLGPGNRVALACPRSVDAVVAVLAILKSGAAYLPLDPDYPAARIADMIEDAQPALVLATSDCEQLVPDALPRLILDQPSTVDELAGRPSSDPADRQRTRPLRPDDPAYLVYTSASTGRPKGVVGSHQGMVNRLAWMAATFPFGETGPTLAKTSLSFIDGSTELLGPLLAGATTVLADPVSARSPAALAELISRHAIGRLTVVPSLLAAILDDGDPGRLASCRLWLSSGAALSRPLCQRFHDLVPGARLVNLYGTSEASGDSLFHVCGPADVSIGRPIWNTRAYVVNDALEPVPVGSPGELCLAGAGLAAGYFGRPELTNERFVADPGNLPESRIYRTGDRARWQADGTLEFLGRTDQQVNLHGIRIEPTEIEAALIYAPSVKEAVVILRDDGAVAGRLVAFVVAEQSAKPPNPADLRAHLITVLPEPMIPAVFVVMPELPRLPNGKLDRQALQVVDLGQTDGDRQRSMPPRTPTEVTLADTWCEVLRCDTVGRQDDFFALGGDSLSATQVMSRVRKLFALNLPLSAIFEARTLMALAERIDAAARDSRNVSPLPPIRPIEDDRPAPLSFSQQRMWVIQSLDPGNTAYNMSGALRLTGQLDIDALRQALDAIRQRHEILRTVYQVTDGQVVQQPQPSEAEPLRVVDLRPQFSDPLAEATRLANAEAGTPIDLTHGPVLRGLLMQIGDDDHVLQLTMHHIAGDQWSIGVFGRELASLYNAIRAGRAPQLPSAPVRYRDFAAWQRGWLADIEAEPQLQFWRRTLAGVPPLELPIDHARPRIQMLRGTYSQSGIAPALLSELELFGRREAATLFMTMLAGFAALLHRLSGQTDLAIGVPVANRNQSAVEQVIGTFVNTLVIRIDLSGDPTFNELLQRVRAAALDAFAHQDLPFDKLVHELVQTRDTSRAPLTQVLFNMMNAPMHGIDFDGLAWEPVQIDRGGAQFELSLSVDHQVTRSVSLEYNTDLFEPATAQRLIGRYLHLLESAASMPSRRLSELELLPDEERNLLLQGWNATAAPVPDVPFIRLFEAQASARPDAVAVAFEGATVSYRELNASANTIARELRALGVGPGVLVGMCMERSPAMLAALLGIQKSGGAYVPLDPVLPSRRLAYLMADSGVRVLVTKGPNALAVDTPAGVGIVDLNSVLGAEGAADAVNLDVTPAATDPAYVIYTSGSTGQPKGVAVSHGALVNFLCSMQREPGLTSADVLAAVTTISFDIAGLELYLPLMVGARIELVATAMAGDGKALGELISSRDITIMQATPATWRMLLEAGWSGGSGFRALCGGEALPRDLANALVGRVDELWNLYGPTETTIWSTVSRVEAGEGPVGIGRPIANTQVYIVNGGAPAPIGVAGEICIGGHGVAIGYHQRPYLTSERFVADPFAAAPAARIYRTGDLGRWTADGQLQHLGRIDHQVKIRGFRVEPGEVEAALASHPAVRTAVAVVHEVEPGDHRFVAYIVYEPGADITFSELRRFLQLYLPDYMVPMMAIAIDKIPLTPNGKLDRSALPDPFAHATRPVSAYEVPAAGPEAMIAGLWKELLGAGAVGAEDNFFELGGHSLLALRFVAQLEKRTGVRIDPRLLFFQSLRQIAANLSELPPVAEAKRR